MKDFTYLQRYYSAESGGDKAPEQKNDELLRNLSKILSAKDPSQRDAKDLAIFDALKTIIKDGKLSNKDMLGIKSGLQSMHVSGKLEKWAPTLREVGLGQMVDALLNNKNIAGEWKEVDAETGEVLKEVRKEKTDIIAPLLNDAGIATPTQVPVVPVAPVVKQAAAPIPAAEVSAKAGATAEEKPSGILVDLFNNIQAATKQPATQPAAAPAATAQPTTAPAAAPTAEAPKNPGVAPWITAIGDFFTGKKTEEVKPAEVKPAETAAAAPATTATDTEAAIKNLVSTETQSIASLDDTFMGQSTGGSTLDKINTPLTNVATSIDNLTLKNTGPLDPEGAQRIETAKKQIKESMSTKLGDTISTLVREFKDELGANMVKDITDKNLAKKSASYIADRVEEALKKSDSLDVATLQKLATDTAVGFLTQLNFGYKSLSAKKEDNPNYGKDTDPAFKFHSKLGLRVDMIQTNLKQLVAADIQQKTASDTSLKTDVITTPPNLG